MAEESVSVPTVTCHLSMPDMGHFYAQIRANAKRARGKMIRPLTDPSRTVAICGAGPSLAAAVADRAITGDAVWACNSALPYLVDWGQRVTHGVAIDQGPAMNAAHEFGRALPVAYYLSSSVHPSLVTRLMHANRDIRFFHSYLGIPEPKGWDAAKNGGYEMWLYTHRFDDSVQVGHGLNCVPRAICLALFMGYQHIHVYGADSACRPNSDPMPPLGTPEYAAWLDGLVMYADGRTASGYGPDTVMAEAEIDGVRWHTRPDMVVSARHLIDLTKAHPGRITLHGDTLPNALANKDAEFWARMPTLSGTGQVQGFGNAAFVRAQQTTQQTTQEAA